MHSQNVLGCSFDDAEADEVGYVTAMSGALAEAMGLNPLSIKDFTFFPGSSRRRGLATGAWTAALGLLDRRLQEDAPSEADSGRDSILIHYTVDSNIGTATVASLEDALMQAVTDGDVDSLFADWGAKTVNVTSLADVQVGTPFFSNEYQAPPTSKPLGLPAYAIALIAIACATVLCGGSYFLYYRYHELSHKEDEERLHRGPSSDTVIDSGNPSRLNPVPIASSSSALTHEYDSYEANPYAGQKIAPRRGSTVPKVGHDDM